MAHGTLDTVFFDLDGTLTDSALGITNSILYALGRFGMRKPPREELYRFVGPPLLEEFQAAFGVSREFSAQLLHEFREYFSTRGIFENTPYPGIPEMLARLQSAGLRLVLATSKPEPFAERILDHFALRPYFYAAAGATNDERRTTKEAVLRYAIEKAGADPKRSCMVGDREHDVLGAHRCGVAALGVLYGYGSRAELENAGAEAIAGTVEEAAEILLAWK